MANSCYITSIWLKNKQIRVWSKKNETLSKSAIFQVRKYNFMQNITFHELTTFTDKIILVKNHFDIEKLQFLKIKRDRFYTKKQEWGILKKWDWNIFLDFSRTMIDTLMYRTISESLIPKVSADLKFILVNLIVFLQ